MSRISLALLAGLLILLGSTGRASAQYTITWHTMDGGGGIVAGGGGFTLNGTIAQSVDVGEAAYSGPYRVVGGYWEGGAVPPLCPADFNRSGTVTVQDIYDFLFAWNELNARADINGVDYITVQDIYDFLYLWNAGCP